MWSTITGAGQNFQDPNNPRPVVRVGNSGDRGVAMFVDMLYTNAELTPGAILLEVNIAGDRPGDVGVS